MTTITIPARIVRYLREALHSQLGMAAEDIGQASHEGGRARPVLYAEPLERFDRTRAARPDRLEGGDRRGTGHRQPRRPPPRTRGRIAGAA
jgi:hypothetical protein